MQFIDLASQYQSLKNQIDKRIQTVLDHGHYIMGPEVQALEETLADFVGAKYAIGMASGTDALLVALMALAVGPGDEVITTPFSFYATVETILLLGATPVFVDIDEHTYNLDPQLLESAITKKTKVILPVSLYGQCADYDVINTIAAKYQLPVIEDAAQSFGATYQGKRSCNLTTLSCTSFFPSKPLGGYGDGGMCFTNDETLAMRMRQIRVHGQDRRYHHPAVGVNARLDTLQAAILLAKFEIFEEEVKRREEIAARYTALLKDHVITPTIANGCTSVYAQYTVRVKKRDEIIEYLKGEDIPTAVHYPIPLHKQPVFEREKYIADALPISEKCANEVLSLPMHPYLSAQMQSLVVDKLMAAVARWER